MHIVFSGILFLTELIVKGLESYYQKMLMVTRT